MKKEKLVIKSITITESQANYIERNNINFSKFIRKKLDKIIEEDKRIIDIVDMGSDGKE